MKAGLLTIAALTAVASAQVHRRGHRHARRGDAVEYHQEVQIVTATAPGAIVYVDGNGNPVSTDYPGAPAPTPEPYAPPPPPPAYEAPPEPPKASTPEPPAAPAPAPVEPPKAPEAPKEQSPAPPTYQPKPAPGGSSGQGIVYSPYNNDGTCKSQDQVNADFAKINGYGMVRIYGTDCDQVNTVKTAATAKGMKLFVGIFDINSVQAEADKIIAAVKGDWSSIDTVSVGNELVNAGGSVSAVVAAVNSARSILNAAGYSGPVVTVDTFVAMIANPELCQCSDYAAANAHAFFDGGRTAEQAGEFVLEQSKRVASACGGKKVVITESGWPWQGATNGAAVPSKENQKVAIDSLKSKFPENIFLFTAFDDLWKENNAATHGAECFWGFVEQSA
ncbi:Cell surface mannoprotein [Sphaerulina musiva]